jgi:hemolysin D
MNATSVRARKSWCRCDIVRRLGSKWRDRATLCDSNLSAQQRRFLSTALEVQETPPSPVGRWFVWTVLGLFTIAVLWACFGSVDIVVTAPGRIVPSGQVKSVQAFETGTVQAIHVREGERVELGQELISLDPTYAEADEERIGRQIEEHELELAWRRGLDAWLASSEDREAQRTKMSELEGKDSDRAAKLYEQHVAEINAHMESIERERDATHSELAMARAEIARVTATLPILANRVAVYRTLYEAQYGAKVSYLEILQQLTDMQQSVPVLKAKEQQLISTLAALGSRLSVTREEHRTQNLLQIVRLESEKSAMEQDEKKAYQHRRQQVLTAPVTGTVQQLSIHTVGGVLTPAQELMKIVPEQDTIEVEALLQNRDVGFVNEGQAAEIKVDTFNFTKYGVIDAQLINISDDAVEDQKLGWVFKLRLKLAKDSIPVDNKTVRLSSGMAVTAEIKTGKRRLIEFFLSPLLRYKQESIRER